MTTPDIHRFIGENFVVLFGDAEVPCRIELRDGMIEAVPLDGSVPRSGITHDDLVRRYENVTVNLPDLDLGVESSVPSEGPKLPEVPQYDEEWEWWRDINRVTLIGVVSRSVNMALVKTREGEVPFANLWIRTRENVRRPDKSIWQSEQFHCVKVWRGQARSCSEYLMPGDAVYIEGRLSYEKWTNRHGHKVEATCIAASKVHFLQRKTIRRGPREQRDEGLGHETTSRG